MGTQVLLVGVLITACSPLTVREGGSTSVVADTAGWIAPTAPVHPENPDAGAPLVRFAVAGDVGTGSPAEWATADLMTAAEDAAAFDGLLLLGDNVYPHGDPDRLGETVFDPFAGVLDDGTLLLGVLGNHDVEQNNAEGQMAGLGMP